MASGGHYPNPRTQISNTSAPANNRPRVDNDGENENPGPPWLLTANNLSLHTSAAENRLSKKQRNKTKPKLIPVTDTSPSTESSPHPSGGHRSGPKLSQPVKLSLYKKDDVGENSRYSKMPSDLDQDGSDTDESGAEPIRNFKYPVNQRRQKKNIHNGLITKKAAENFPNISNKQDNTNKLPDTSILVERLMHLRDCIKQVSTIMQNMEKADGPVMRSQLGNLEQMLEQLKSEESEQLELLQQVLTARDGASAISTVSSSVLRNETRALDSSSSTIEYEPEPEQPNDNEDEEVDEETSEAIEKRNELLEKMVASQKKLVALKEQQTALLNMQKKAESRLAEVKAFHEQLLEAGQSNDVEYNGLLSLIQNGPAPVNGDVNRSRNSSAPTSSRVSNGTPEWDLAVNQNSTQVAKGNKLHRKEIKKSSSGGSVNQALSSINTGEIQSLHGRLKALQEFANNQPMKDEPSSNPVDEQAAALSDSHRKKLENKLRELQEKKNQMDNLLAELSMHVTTQVNPVSDATVALDSNQTSAININAEFSPETDNVIAEARQYIESVNTGEKNRQMDGLKKKIKRLKLLTENIEATATLEDDNQPHSDNSQWRGRYPVNKRDKSQGPVLKSDNLRRDHTAPGFPARRHYEAEGRANEDGDNTTQAPAAAAVINTTVSPSTLLTSSQEQSIMEEHAEIEDKVTKLLVAKNKLEKLQSLLGAVHQFRQSGEPLPNDIVQFIATLQPGVEGLNDLSPADGNRTMDDDDSRRNVPNQDLVRLNDVEDLLTRQQSELDHLADERKRLLTMQEQLRILQQHQNAAAAASKNNEQRSSGEGGSVSRKDRNSSNLLAAAPVVDVNRSSRTRIAREDNLQRSRACSMENTHATKDTNSKAANSVNVSRNHPVKYESQPERIDERSLAQLHDELSQSLALRDELQHQKVVLQELLRQEQSKQMGFSQNQDLRSQSGSSEKSELVEAGSSVLAPDTTVAATWGGSSTQDNLDDEVEEEPLESLEEQDEDEGSDTTELKQTDARVQQLLRPFVEEESMIDSETNRERRSVRQCRVHGYKRVLLNQLRKNFQLPMANKKNEQPTYQQPRQETIQPEAVSVEDPIEPANSDGRRRQFTKFFQQQLDQTNTLCQNVLKDQQALSGMLLSCSVSNQPMLAGQANPPDMMRYYSQMFQQQQQLLLSLSHCYHLLYLQQLEIFQLHQYIQQSSESEGTMPHLSPNDEVNFRPWCMTPWLNPPTLQTPFMPPITTPFCFNPPPHPSAPPPSFPLNSGASQVTPTAAQDERGATETLNNQVPPGSRANNFLDNFRSYSRQNLLSGAPPTIPTKSNESSVASTLVTTAPMQMKPSYTFCATSENPRGRDLPNFPGSYSLPSIPSSGGRSSTSTTLPQANNNGARPRTKRPNLNQEQGNGNRRTPACLNLLDAGETLRQNSRSSSVSQDHSHAANLASVMPETLITSRPLDLETTVQPENLETLRDSIYIEVTSLISNYEQQPEMLANLLKQLQKIGSSPNNQSWKALTTIKELMQLRDVNNASSGVKRKGEFRNKVPTTHNLMSLSEFARARLPETLPLSNNNIFTGDNVESTAVRLAEHINESPVDESSSSSTSWPKNSSTTGAIQKKYSRHFVSSANNHGYNATAASESSSQETSSSLDHQVKQAILNLVPYLQNHLHEDCTLHLQAQLCGHVMNALQSLPVHQQSLRFFRSQLLQTMQQTLAKYLGKRVRDCEEDMLMELTEVVLKELSLHKIMRKKKDESHADWMPSQLDNNSLLNRNEIPNHGALHNSESVSGTKMEFDSPHSHEGRFLGSEGLSENELFHNEVKNIVMDQRDWTEVADAHHGQASESSVESSSQRSHLDIQPDRLDVRAAPDGIAAAPALVLPVSPRLLEEESGYDCDAEGETEPEVEAENDDTKNLAEADQSSGQIASLNDRLPHCLRDNIIGNALSNSRNPLRSLSPHNALNDERHDIHLLNGEIVSMQDNGATGAEALCQGQTSAAEGEELSLDDIPTKLETLTPDELRRQIADEQASNSIIHEIVSDSQHNIVGDKDDAKDPGAL